MARISLVPGVTRGLTCGLGNKTLSVVCCGYFTKGLDTVTLGLTSNFPAFCSLRFSRISCCCCWICSCVLLTRSAFISNCFFAYSSCSCFSRTKALSRSIFSQYCRTSHNSSFSCKKGENLFEKRYEIHQNIPPMGQETNCPEFALRVN